MANPVWPSYWSTCRRRQAGRDALFDAITEDMDIVFENMTGGGNDGEGGGPKRGFKAAAKATQPAPDVS